MKWILLIFSLSLSSCTSNQNYKPETLYGFRHLQIIYNSHSNALVGNTIMLRSLGDVSMFLHEYGHALERFHLKPSDHLVKVLSKSYEIPPKIEENFINRELQDFITTSTRWKVKYTFRHSEDCQHIVSELLANLFVIFTIGGEELEYIRIYYPEVYREYSIYYKALK